MHALPILFLALALVTLSSCAEKRSADAVPEEASIISLAEQGDLPLLNAMLKAGAEPNVIDACQWTPLMKAALNGHLGPARQLLVFGADVHASDKGGYTALMLAASNNHAAMVELLGEWGAAVDARETTSGWTALIWAAKRGHQEAVEALLVLGADQGMKGYDGRSARDWARANKHPEVLALLSTHDRGG